MHPRSQTPARIVALLQERGPMLRPELAAALGIHVVTFDQHLVRVRDQVVIDRLACRGNPAVYRVRGDARERPAPAPAVQPAPCACGDCPACEARAMRRVHAARTADARDARKVPPPAPSGTRLVRGLPVLREGPGDRDETCVEYVGCLDRFTRLSAAHSAHCPETCTERRAVDWRIERDEHAGRRDASAMTF